MNEKNVQPAVLRIPEGLQVPAQVICHATSLRRASRRICQLYDAIMAPCGLRSTQRSILMQIARNQALSMTDLAYLLVLDRSALAQNLKPLEREGFVAVEVDPDDRRSRLVRLTQSGIDKLFHSQVLWEQAQRCYESALGAEQAQELRQLLSKVSAAGYGEHLPATTP
ncbi:MarR family transcriptional regulator [Pseudomonas cichorii]|uniref:MarR family transcriptional regulator n=1 Tax=Pseudomonas cichorii TaxID=36746 RepID=A0A3M4LMG7_PSECI|nr:MarR family winged helix-turn-helix transcriptional regulator [Pseudomonas cichorii]RMQ42667.1 MarR family transcriptional regulator [Pseudomonas cichorii]